jgi:hypothetical protein
MWIDLTVIVYFLIMCDDVRPTGGTGTPPSFTIVASAPAKWAVGDAYWYERFERSRVGAACMGGWRSEAGGEVFTAGSTDWACATIEALSADCKFSLHLFALTGMLSCKLLRVDTGTALSERR